MSLPYLYCYTHGSQVTPTAPRNLKEPILWWWMPVAMRRHSARRQSKQMDQIMDEDRSSKSQKLWFNDGLQINKHQTTAALIDWVLTWQSSDSSQILRDFVSNYRLPESTRDQFLRSSNHLVKSVRASWGWCWSGIWSLNLTLMGLLPYPTRQQCKSPS